MSSLGWISFISTFTSGDLDLEDRSVGKDKEFSVMGCSNCASASDLLSLLLNWDVVSVTFLSLDA